MVPLPVIIDTDPGQDDALAILLALASPELRVLGLATVAGNVPLPLTTLNARKICALAGRPDVPVFAGCARPMIRPPVTAEHVHGASGLDGADLPEPAMPAQPRHAVDWLIATLMERPAGSVTLCPIGPLTNIAMALAKEPAIAGRVREIVLMGGSVFAGGNVTPAAEFNIHADPQAAHAVFSSGIRLTMVPLDCTRHARVTRPWLRALRAAGGRVAGTVADLLAHYGRFEEGGEGEALHDPCAVAYLLRPDWFEGRSCAVSIETDSALTMGMTVVDWHGRTGRPANAFVLERLEAARFLDLLLERLASLG